MSHEIAKLLLEHAGTFLERREAIKTALSMGMPLSEIEVYLDWLDTMPNRVSGDPPHVDNRTDQNQPPPS